MLEAVCPNGHRLQIPPEHAGMKLRCPACNAIFQLAGVPQNPGASGLGLQNAGAGQPHAPAAPAPAVPAAEPPPARWAGSEAGAAPPPPASSAPPPVPPTQRVGPAALRRIDLGGAARLWGQIALMVGLVLVLSARGCDGLALRNISRLQANLELEKNRLDDAEAEEKTSHQNKLANPQEPAAAQETARKKIEEIKANYDRQRTELAGGSLYIAARDAEAENRTWAYWREMAFVAGSIVLSLGLIALIMDGINAERYLAFGMLAIILFSLYIGGTAWIGSIFSTASRPPAVTASPFGVR